MKQKNPPYYSESLARGLSVLQAFDDSEPRLRINAVAERTGLSRAAARRFLLTLRDLGYVGSDGEAFFLRPHVLDLGYKYLSSQRIDKLIQPQLNEIAERTQEASTFAVLDGVEVLIIARAAKRTWDHLVGSGSRLPAHLTALGQALLAGLSPVGLERFFSEVNLTAPASDAISNEAALRDQLKQVQKRGYAIVQGQLIKQLMALAVPIIDIKGNTIAALNVTSYTTATKAQLVKNFLPALADGKLQIESAVRSSNLSLEFGLNGDSNLQRPESRT